MVRLLTAALLFVFSSALVYCASAASDLGIENFDTNVPARNVVFWVDDSRVLFPGFASPSSNEDDKNRNHRSVLYVWNEEIGTARIHAEVPEGGLDCSSGGYVSYTIRKSGAQYMRSGKLGEELERRWTPATRQRMVDIDEVTCKEFDFGSADKIYPGFLFFPLREGDGYYGWRREKTYPGSKSVYYLAPGAGKKPVRLPVEGRDLVREFHSPYFRAYVFECLPSRRDEKTVGTAWVIGTDGATKRFTVRAGPWMGATVWMAPARTGVVWSSRALDLGKRDPGAAGVYLVRGGQVERLIEGFPGRPTVSPNGCKVAVVVAPVGDVRRPATLRILTLCRPLPNQGR